MQHRTTQCNTVQWNTVQNNTLQHNAAQNNTMQHSAAQCHTEQHKATQQSTQDCANSTTRHTPRNSTPQHNTIRYNPEHNFMTFLVDWSRLTLPLCAFVLTFNLDLVHYRVSVSPLEIFWLIWSKMVAGYLENDCIYLENDCAHKWRSHIKKNGKLLCISNKMTKVMATYKNEMRIVHKAGFCPGWKFRRYGVPPPQISGGKFPFQGVPW